MELTQDCNDSLFSDHVGSGKNAWDFANGAHFLVSIAREGIVTHLKMSSTSGCETSACVDLANYVQSLSGLPHDDAKAAAGKRLFATCAACHDADGRGNMALGAPNLTDSTWLYGWNLETLTRTIRDGRAGIMPAWRTRLGEDRVRAVAAWVYAQSRASARVAQ